MESSMKTISRPVIDRLPVGQLDEFACRQLDKVRTLLLCIGTMRPGPLSQTTGTCNVWWEAETRIMQGSLPCVHLPLRAGCAELRDHIRWSLLSIACSWHSGLC